MPEFPWLTPKPARIKRFKMTSITNLTTGQLHRILAIKEQIQALHGQIESIAAGGGSGVPTPASDESPAPARRKYHMTAAHKRKLIKALAKARKIRLAGLKNAKAAPKPAKKDKRSSPATRAKLAAAAKARWARVKAQGKKTL